MKIMSSSEFRKSYATIADTTVVTVNGHSIGVWTPRIDIKTDPDWIDVPVNEGLAHLPDGRTIESPSQILRVPVDRFNTQPFRGPIPTKR
jgi:hypothetical protein